MTPGTELSSADNAMTELKSGLGNPSESSLEKLGVNFISTESSPKKRTVKEFLRQYRALGLPGAKKMRRRTRLEEAKHKHDVDMMLASQLITQMKMMIGLMNTLKTESNWAVSDEAVMWVGESDPLEIIRKAEKELTAR